MFSGFVFGDPSTADNSPVPVFGGPLHNPPEVPMWEGYHPNVYMQGSDEDMIAHRRRELKAQNFKDKYIGKSSVFGRPAHLRIHPEIHRQHQDANPQFLIFARN